MLKRAHTAMYSDLCHLLLQEFDLHSYLLPPVTTPSTTLASAPVSCDPLNFDDGFFTSSCPKRDVASGDGITSEKNDKVSIDPYLSQAEHDTDTPVPQGEPNGPLEMDQCQVTSDPPANPPAIPPADPPADLAVSAPINMDDFELSGKGMVAERAAFMKFFKQRHTERSKGHPLTALQLNKLAGESWLASKARTTYLASCEYTASELKRRRFTR